MKKLVAINLVLLTMFLVLPNMKIEINETQIEIEGEVVEASEIVVQAEQLSYEVTSRGGNVSNRVEKNLNISYNMDLRTKSNLTVEDLEKAFAGTDMEGLGKYFIQAEKEYGINAIYLASLGIHESGWGSSNFAKERNNLFGWQSYDSNLNATKYFETKGDGVLHVAKFLSKNYLTEDGCYFNGYTMKDISKKYASDKEHSTKIFNIMKTVVNRIEQ